MNIIYCHHGNRKKGNPSTQEDGLTKLGIKDAKLVAQLLKDIKQKNVQIRAIFTSNFFRCKKTAQLINKHIKVPIYEEPRLNEHGSNTGESWLDTQKRITQVIDELIQKYDDSDTVICVTSGVNIAPFISKAYGIKANKNTPFLGVPNCCPISFSYKKENTNEKTR